MTPLGPEAGSLGSHESEIQVLYGKDGLVFLDPSALV